MRQDDVKQVWSTPRLEQIAIVDTATKPENTSENRDGMNPGQGLS